MTMEKLRVEEILKATKGTLESGDRNTWIEAVSTDTRTVKRGDYFIPLVGKNFDGHDFIKDAASKGATGVLISKKVTMKFPDNFIVIRVKDTLKALGDIARYYRKKFSPKLIAITGSNGKTTTKEMVCAILSKKYSVVKSEGNLNNEVGLPLGLLKIDGKAEVAVFELGMSGLGEIRRLSGICQPDVGVITNIGESHLEFLKTKRNVAKGKGEIMENIASNGWVVLNADDEYFGYLKKMAKCRVHAFGIKNESDTFARNVSCATDGTRSFTVNKGNKVKLSTIGNHNIYNCLAAMSVGRILKLSYAEMAETISRFVIKYSRMEIKKIKGIKVIDDTYNSNPKSMRVAVDAISGMTAEKKAVVMGDMLELGKNSSKMHGEIGEYIAGHGIDFLFGFGNDTAFAVEKAKDSGIKNAVLFESKKELVDAVRKNMKRGDLILVKGSRGMKMEEVIERLK